MNRILTIFLITLATVTSIHASEKFYWDIKPDGSIMWDPSEKRPHYDFIEMSGKKISAVLYYQVNEDGSFYIAQHIIWPGLRQIPNNTYGSLKRAFSWDPISLVDIGKEKIANDKVDSISLKGMLTVYSTFWDKKYRIKREFLPSAELPAFIEKYTVLNCTNEETFVTIPNADIIYNTPAEMGVGGTSYKIRLNIVNDGKFRLSPGDSVVFGATIAACPSDQPNLKIDIDEEKAKRMSLVDFWMNNLVLETPDPVIDRMQAFSKIRACESIFATKGGPMHGPGGERYYAAIWANDQCEYIDPFFPYMGYEYGNASALNSFMLYSRFINSDYAPVPSSIIAEGDDIWNGAGDEGDAAMIAHGGGRYALARGDKAEAEKIWPLLEWCLEYCKRNLNEDGVLRSDNDELEGRFPSGDANLLVSSLYYDGLVSAGYLAKALGKNGSEYERRARTLRQNIEKYFGADVQGYHTYAYYKGCKVVRSWICAPLAMGIDERKDGTLDALFNELWTENGLLTQAGTNVFWDRSTLTALRSLFVVGATEKGLDFLKRYSRTRLLGEHVPYAIEAWPEGNQSHLSAESGLYDRIIIEGLFGIRPTGFRSFTLTPRLPQEWDHMNLRNIHAFGSTFDLEVSRTSNGKIAVSLKHDGKTRNYVLKPDSTVKVTI